MKIMMTMIQPMIIYGHDDHVMIIWWWMPSQTVIQDYSRHPANCPEYRAVGIPTPLCYFTFQWTCNMCNRLPTAAAVVYVCAIVCMTQAIGWAFRALAPWADRHPRRCGTDKRPVCRYPLQALFQWPPNLTIIIFFAGLDHENSCTMPL